MITDKEIQKRLVGYAKLARNMEQVLDYGKVTESAACVVKDMLLVSQTIIEIQQRTLLELNEIKTMLNSQK